MRKDNTITVSARIPLKLKEKMIKENLNTRECIDIALSVKNNPKKENELKLKKLLIQANIILQEIEVIKQNLDITESNEVLLKTVMSNDEIDAISIVVDRFRAKRGNSNLSIYDFVASEEGSRIINIKLSELSISKGEFIEKIIKASEVDIIE